MKSIARAAFLLATPILASAQVFTLTPQQLIDYTVKNPFERFADGRPKVPERFFDRAKAMSAEEVWAVLPGKGFRNQYEGNFQVLHPGKKMIGRAFTVQFMPMRPDVDDVLQERAKQKGMSRWANQAALDMLQPGDVLVVDLFGKEEGGTIVGDNLFYYAMKATHAGGLIVDGSIRDLEGISEMDMPAYFRHVHPTPIQNVMLTGINIPVRIGGVTVLPGDMVFGDKEGVYFIPPHMVEAVLDNADVIHIHDEWTRKKFDEGKYKSSEIYPTPADPALKAEYAAYLKKRLAEIRAH